MVFCCIVFLLLFGLSIVVMFMMTVMILASGHQPLDLLLLFLESDLMFLGIMFGDLRRVMGLRTLVCGVSLMR